MRNVHLLDTPKRTSLTAHSTTLRTKLKDWEKSFAAIHEGRKPGKDDIKNCPDISKAYKEYNRVRDVLAGKLDAQALQSPRTKKTSTSGRHGNGNSNNTEGRIDAKVTFTPQKIKGPHRHETHPMHPNQIDPYDPPASASPRPYLLNAIGPTPQRDGKVLGLFDLLSNSGRSSKSTPTARKRNIDAAQDIPGEQANAADSGGMIAQTPSRKRSRNEDRVGDLLEHLDGGPDSASRQRHQRTPASEGKKFMLSQFFTTPSTMRFATITEEENHSPKATNTGDKAPLKSHVLRDQSHDVAKTELAAPDATPAYLKRSYSFKDRLLSVSTSTSGTIRAHNANASQNATTFTSPSAVRTGPPTLRRYKSGPKPLSEIVRGLRKIEDERHDDDLDALRELEGGGPINALVEDSQFAGLDDGEAELVAEADDDTENHPPRRLWKKKGQKRSTRRANMRPVKMKPRDDNVWVAEDAGDDDSDGGDDEDNQSAAVQEMQDVAVQKKVRGGNERPIAEGSVSGAESGDVDYDDDDEEFDGDDADENVNGTHKILKNRHGRSTSNPRHDKHDFSTSETGKATKQKRKVKDKAEKKTGPTINPNAISHMNFRSLKIKNKNSKAKGGRGKLGRKGR